MALESLTFYQCRGINDEVVKNVAGLTNLIRFSLYSEELLGHETNASARVTDVGLANLRRLTRLQYLNLFGQQVSDASAPVLGGMPELSELALSGRGFTDAGLLSLSRLTNLRNLRLFETGVTTNGTAALRQRLPQLQLQA